MAKKVVKKAPAADLKKGDMRSQVLNKGKPQPAVDLKQSNPRDLRNKALREANKKANKVKAKPQVKIDFEKIIPKELQKPGQPDLKRPKSNVPRPGKAPWAPRIPKGTTGGAKIASNIASSTAAGYLKTVAKRLPLLDIFNPNFMNYKTEAKLAAEKQAASPPKYGRSLRAEAEARKKAAFGTGGGNPKTVNPYRKASSMAGGSKMAKSTQSGAVRPKISMAGGGVNKPETASTFKQKNLAANQKVGKDASSAQAAPKAAAPAPAAAPKQPKGMTFQQAVRRNVTEEYTKKKMKPKGSLLGLLRKRKSMG